MFKKSLTTSLLVASALVVSGALPAMASGVVVNPGNATPATHVIEVGQTQIGL